MLCWPAGEKFLPRGPLLTVVPHPIDQLTDRGQRRDDSIRVQAIRDRAIRWAHFFAAQNLNNNINKPAPSCL